MLLPSKQPSVVSPAGKKATIDNSGWSRTSRGYGQILAPATKRACETMIVAAAGVRPITSTSRVLDVGSGTGSVTNVVRQRYSEVPILATDLAPGMVEALKAQNIPNVTVGIADATDLTEKTVPSGSFTHVFASQVIQFCGEKQSRVCSEIFRALEPGGVGCVAMAQGISLGEPWDRACSKLDPNYEAPDSYYDELAWKTTEPCIAAMKEAGFVDLINFEEWAYAECHDPDEYSDFWVHGNYPIALKQMKAWKGNLEDVIPVYKELMREQYSEPSVLGAEIATVIAVKPL